MHRTFDFCLRPARKDSNVPQLMSKLRACCPNIYTVPRGSKSACKVDQAGSMKNGTRKTRANNEKTAKRTKKAVV